MLGQELSTNMACIESLQKEVLGDQFLWQLLSLPEWKSELMKAVRGISVTKIFWWWWYALGSKNAWIELIRWMDVWMDG